VLNLYINILHTACKAENEADVELNVLLGRKSWSFPIKNDRILPTSFTIYLNKKFEKSICPF